MLDYRTLYVLGSSFGTKVWEVQAMTQMSQAVANLKLNLAETRAREDQLDAMIRQFETQLARIPRQICMEGRLWTWL